MTNPDLTLIAALLDRSGSMKMIKTDTEGGFNAFIEEQAKLPGNVDVTLAQFDTEFDWVYRNVPVAEVPPLRLEPRGSTALLDSIGKLVTNIGAELATRPARLRPGLVIVVITTDGHENASAEWTVKRVRRLITQQQDVYKWRFIFLGANINAVDTGASYGIPTASSLDYTADSMGTHAVYAAASASVSNMRGGGDGAFSTETRRAAKHQER
jgi:hypothetical protein